MGNSDNIVTIGQPLSSGDFSAMLTTFKTDVDVILVDELSDQDLRGLLKELRSAQNIHYEPSVEAAYPTLKSFLDRNDINFDVTDFKMDIAQAIVEFKSRQGKSNVVIFTGLQTKQVKSISKRQANQDSADNVLAEPAGNFTDVFGDNCAATFEQIYFEDMSDATVRPKRVDINVDSATFDCSEKKSTLKLKVSSDMKLLSGQVEEMTLIFEQSANTQYWLLSGNSSIKSSVGTYGVTYMGSPYGMETPNKFSFVCTRTYFQLYNNTVDLRPLVKVSLYMTNLQVQPSLLQSNGSEIVFGRANYCQGFFTSGIWMALICSFLLAIILAAGISCLANINTMDRFDDPKGKPLTIAQEK